MNPARWSLKSKEDCRKHLLASSTALGEGAATALLGMWVALPILDRQVLKENSEEEGRQLSAGLSFGDSYRTPEEVTTEVGVKTRSNCLIAR